MRDTRPIRAVWMVATAFIGCSSGANSNHSTMSVDGAHDGDASATHQDSGVKATHDAAPSSEGGTDSGAECDACSEVCFAGACTQSDPRTCGGACSSGDVCIEGFCVDPKALTGNDAGSHPDGNGMPGALCSDAADCESKVCRVLCLSARCGDGVCNGDESTVSCADDCGSKCGDGAANGKETCDDGNTKAGDGCNPACKTEAGFSCNTARPNVCRDADACPNAQCAKAQHCEDLPPPAPADKSGRKCVKDAECGDGECGKEETASSCAIDCLVCGDHQCDPPETHDTCPDDCVCGNGACDDGESYDACPDDCTCGDGTCGADETHDTCPADCRCGDGACNNGESSTSCPSDCVCGNHSCDPGESESNCPGECHCGNGMCERYWAEMDDNCPEDCSCGDGVCTDDEGFKNCPDDCTCGNDLCDPGEDDHMCPADCHCGNKICNPDFGENGDNCASDCKCGDGACDARETKDSCPADC